MHARSVATRERMNILKTAEAKERNASRQTDRNAKQSLELRPRITDMLAMSS